MAGIKKEQSRPQKLPSKQPEGIGPDVIGKIETPKNKGCDINRYTFSLLKSFSHIYKANNFNQGSC